MKKQKSIFILCLSIMLVFSIFTISQALSFNQVSHHDGKEIYGLTVKKDLSMKINDDRVMKAESTQKQIQVTATAYTAYCEGCSGTTYTGIDLIENPNQKVIAVDPNVIPLGSKVYVEGYGTAIAADIGSAIKGNRIDVFIPSEEKAFNWGVKELNVTILS